MQFRVLCILLRCLPFVLVVSYFNCAQAVLPTRTAKIELEGSLQTDSLIVLPASWIEIDSLKLFRNHEELKEFTHWRLIEPGNKIWLYKPLLSNDTLVIDYTYRPIPLFKTYFNHTLRELKHKASSGQDSTRNWRITRACTLKAIWHRLSWAAAWI